MKLLINRIMLMCFFSISLPAIAIQCETIPSYSNTTKTNYVSDTLVVHESKVYKCLVGGWCNLIQLDEGTDKLDPIDDFVFGHAIPYIPGVGWAWDTAWQYMGQCDCGIQSLSPGGYGMCNTTLGAEEGNSLTAIENLSKIRSQLNAATKLPQTVTPGNTDNPENVKRVERIISEQKWREIFPLASQNYTYLGFLKATALFPYFCKLYNTEAESDRICRKTLATLFAHIAFESGAKNPSLPTPEWLQGLSYSREQYVPSSGTQPISCPETGPGCEYNNECSNADVTSTIWPCGRNSVSSFVKYFGRGAIPIKSRAEYALFSEIIFRDPKILLDNPQRVALDYINLATAIYSILKPYTPGPSMVHLIDGTWKPNQRDIDAGIVPGFGATINLKHSSLACGTGTATSTAEKLGSYYKSFSLTLQNNITNEQLSCHNMKFFSTMGNGLAVYWDKHFINNPNNPEQKAFSCIRVPYKTPFTIFDKEIRPSGTNYSYDGYKNCVANYYGVNRMY